MRRYNYNGAGVKIEQSTIDEVLYKTPWFNDGKRSAFIGIQGLWWRTHDHDNEVSIWAIIAWIIYNYQYPHVFVVGQRRFPLLLFLFLSSPIIYRIKAYPWIIPMVELVSYISHDSSISRWSSPATVTTFPTLVYNTLCLIRPCAPIWDQNLPISPSLPFLLIPPLPQDFFRMTGNSILRRRFCRESKFFFFGCVPC